ncbi:unnamed protein product [Protopolystoma xenopodis]|uniref:Uncharacterized protein n=1 Tax=Protopolystoma xenopodis TaxID=117903 RepID=A0A3S5AD58_9PLAT|nr:unnamed protein product [Protopolystoma xenopodis]
MTARLMSRHISGFGFSFIPAFAVESMNEVNFTQNHLKKAPRNESAWNYLYGLLVPPSVPSDSPDQQITIQLPPAHVLARMRIFFDELAASDPSVQDSPAPLSFLLEVLADCLILKLATLRVTNDCDATSCPMESEKCICSVLLSHAVCAVLAGMKEV